MREDYDSALVNAVQIKTVNPHWPGGYFLQAAALKKHNQLESAKQEIEKGIIKHFEWASPSRSISPRQGRDEWDAWSVDASNGAGMIEVEGDRLQSCELREGKDRVKVHDRFGRTKLENIIASLF